MNKINNEREGLIEHEKTTNKNYAVLIIEQTEFCTITRIVYYNYSEATTGGVLSEKLFLEISQNSQENTSAKVSAKFRNRM